MKVHKICTFLIVVTFYFLIHTTNSFAQSTPLTCDELVSGNCGYYPPITDTITIPIPGFPSCYVLVYYTYEWCVSLNGLEAKLKIDNIIYFPDGCLAFSSTLFPSGYGSPPNEIFLRDNWIAISSALSKEFNKRYWNTLSTSEKEEYYCDNGGKFFSYSAVSGYCLKYCMGIYTNTNPTTTGPYTYYSVNYQDCDPEGCCLIYETSCIDRPTGNVINRSRTVTATGVGDDCLNTNPPSNCVFLSLSILGYSLQVKQGACTMTCPE